MASTILALGNEACMQIVGSVAEQMLDAIGRYQLLQIDLSDAVNADLSIIQLIEAARRHGDAVGCDLSLVGTLPPTVRETLDRAGFTSAATPADNTFWNPGDIPQ